MNTKDTIYPKDLPEKSDERIVNDIKTHTTNAAKLLMKAREIQLSVLEIENLDNYVSEMKKAIEFQQFSIKEIEQANDLQKIYLERLNAELRLQA